jgi:hypothetical protein
VHKAQADTGENHAVSAMKFGILKQVGEAASRQILGSL